VEHVPHVPKLLFFVLNEDVLEVAGIASASDSSGNILFRAVAFAGGTSP